MKDDAPRSLLLVRTGATGVLSMAVCQAGLAAGTFFGGVDQLRWHGLFGLVTMGVTIVTAILAGLYVRDGGPRWVLWFSLVVVAWATVQVTLGRLEIAAPHAFSGTLFAMLATAFTSWVFRHRHDRVAGSAAAGRADTP